MQIPIVGRASAYRAAMISLACTRSRLFTQAANAPTPGTTKPSASRAICASDVRITSSPEVANARAADRRLPEP